MPYTRAQLLEAVRTDHPEFRNVDDNKLFAAIAQDHPDLARGISELNGSPYQSPKYFGGYVSRTTGQVASDQAAEVLKGIPQAVTGLPGMITEAFSRKTPITVANPNKFPSGPVATGPPSPFVGTAKQGVELVKPGTVNAPTPDAPETAAAAREAGMMLGTAELPNVIAGVKQLATPAFNAALKTLPSKTRAGAKFEQVMSKAKDVPLDTSEAQSAVERAQELRTRGSSMPKVLNDFAKNRKAATGDFMGVEVTDPMSYEVGRDFASNAGALSTREVTAMNAKMQAQVAKFAKAMKDANRQAAESVGMGDLYDQAMKEYRQAANLQEASVVARKWAIRAGLGVLGIEGAKRLGVLHLLGLGL